MAANGYRPQTPRQLAADELHIDQARGRRYCRVHRQQQMLPLLAGVDVCPVCSGEGSLRPPRAERRPDHSHPSKGQVAETPGTRPSGEEGNTP
jgi:hypothetical protein